MVVTHTLAAGSPSLATVAAEFCANLPKMWRCGGADHSRAFGDIVHGPEFFVEARVGLRLQEPHLHPLYRRGLVALAFCNGQELLRVAISVAAIDGC